MDEVTSEVPAGLKRAGVAAIRKFDHAYFDDGGLAELEAEVEEKRAGVAGYIYRLAVQSSKQRATMDEAIALFRGVCAYAEGRYKEEHEIENVKERIPAWTQFKSRIIRAMRAGLDPIEYGSERSLRDALADYLRKQRTPRTEPQAVEDWLAKSGVHDILRTSLARLVIEVEYILPEKRRAAETILKEAAAALSAMVDKERIASDATKEAVEAARKAA